MVSMSQCAKQAAENTTLTLKTVVSMGSFSRGFLYFIISSLLHRFNSDPSMSHKMKISFFSKPSNSDDKN